MTARAELGSRALFEGLETEVYANHVSLGPPSMSRTSSARCSS
jgi:hypothetical protein